MDILIELAPVSDVHKDKVWHCCCMSISIFEIFVGVFTHHEFGSGSSHNTLMHPQSNIAS